VVPCYGKDKLKLGNPLMEPRSSNWFVNVVAAVREGFPAGFRDGGVGAVG
jgi:hypothetical protein